MCIDIFLKELLIIVLFESCLHPLGDGITFCLSNNMSIRPRPSDRLSMESAGIIAALLI